MKKTHFRAQGFLAGFLTAALGLGLGGAALGASRSIQIDDGISVTINGAHFVPRDAKGQEVPLFAYNGTTYAPVRALCEAAGMAVSYDGATRTAQVTTGDRTLAADPNAGSYISAERARQIALDHAKVSADDAVFLQTKLDREDSRTCYDVEFYSGNMEYDYDIDASTGAVVSFDHELENYTIHSTGAAAPSEELISDEKARELALGRAPAGSRVVKCELDREDGRYVYEVELQNGRTEYECDINAVTGVILKWEVDYD